ncbi:MAG TPA: maltose alpha-D-glucosyltransferase, partial [Gemmatimonadaceae bacterium]|nr:maltose alpha-D-glucosyltransferase [Gemmatimonadaceae bacterium]
MTTANTPLPPLFATPAWSTPRSTAGADASLWYRDAVIYQLHVRAYHDANGDGIGDFRGLTAKLDYVRDLGATAIWLLPFYPSPLRDDGYDIADYTDIHPSYGTLADFRVFLRAAHQRGLRVITELVLNHTSDQHAWFQRARRAPPGSSQRDFYVWSDSPDRYREARVIFPDFEPSNWTWDPVANAYYWHRFYAHQPDLNYDNPAVREAVWKAMDFWLRLGVDGFRLDAVPYLHEAEGTSCENLPATHEELRALRAHIDERFSNRVLLAEANQWPEDAVAYFGEGDECHMAFHFPLMPRIFMAVQMENRFPLIDILAQTPELPDGCQWALFLRNHDELTLEMVTDEERDYMYRVYANDPRARINLGIRRRLAPLVGNDRRTMELLNGLLFSLPGTPVVYYGDEIGMGDNIYLGDRNGVRTPMQWSEDRNAGFSRAHAQQLFLPVNVDAEYSYETVNVQAQHDNPSSLLWWMRRLVTMRQRFPAFGRGSLEFLRPSNRKVLAYLRQYEDETLLVVANLSRHAQFVELDLSRFRDFVPVEIAGGTPFPPLGDLPYLLTMGGHSFYWFRLVPPDTHSAGVGAAASTAPLPVIDGNGTGRELLSGRPDDRVRRQLEHALPGMLLRMRQPRGEERSVARAIVQDMIPIENGVAAALALVQVTYREGPAESFCMPLALDVGPDAAGRHGAAALARVGSTGDGHAPDGVLFDASTDERAGAALFDLIARRRQLKGSAGTLVGIPTRALRSLTTGESAPAPTAVRGDFTNALVRYGDRFQLKLFRHVDAGIHPAYEMSRFLTERARFAHVPPLAGVLEYRADGRPSTTVGIMHGYIPNEGDAWSWTVDAVGRFVDLVRSLPEGAVPSTPPSATLFEASEQQPPGDTAQLIGSQLEDARLLGQRTAELHLALVSWPDEPGFEPDPFTPYYQRSLFQSMRNLTEAVFTRLDIERDRLRGDARGLAESLLADRERLLHGVRSRLTDPIAAARTRLHGHYHLGQVLWTGRDFVILDFEGNPAVPLSARRIKRSPLYDVAGMVLSLHSAAHVGLLARTEGDEALARRLRPWAHEWFLWNASTFVG